MTADATFSAMVIRSIMTVLSIIQFNPTILPQNITTQVLTDNMHAECYMASKRITYVFGRQRHKSHLSRNRNWRHSLVAEYATTSRTARRYKSAYVVVVNVLSGYSRTNGESSHK